MVKLPIIKISPFLKSMVVLVCGVVIDYINITQKLYINPENPKPKVSDSPQKSHIPPIKNDQWRKPT